MVTATLRPAAAEPVWRPDAGTVADAVITRFAQQVGERHGVDVTEYRALHAWSVEHLEDFWAEVWRFFDVRSEPPYEQVLAERVMPGARWFTGARLNYAQHALRTGADDSDAVLAVTEDGERTSLSRGDLRRQVSALAARLRELGVRPGERVVGYLPNGPHAVVAFLATASIGAVWSACGQDYGAQGALDRFGQLEPVVLFAADGYQWNGRRHDRRGEVEALRAGLPTLRASVAIPHLGLEAPANSLAWAEATEGDLGSPTMSTAGGGDLAYEIVPFDHPLWILFSSGTTGLPKGIVHGHGGVLLEQYKSLGLHLDLGPGDRFFWYTTTNWMMWNMVVSGLLLGATIVVYDGSPAWPGPDRLWRLAEELRITALGTSPGYLLGSAKAGVVPREHFDLSALETIGSTGSPLPGSAQLWARDNVGPDVHLASSSGGTDVVGAFAGGAPNLPEYAGEIAAPALGVALDSWDPAGRPVRDEVGELVVTAPMPSMPIGFWNDPDGARYRDAYFSTYPGVWRHGDWITITSRGSVVISGRSDSTLNRQGVRLGSADIYEVVEKLPGVREALVIGAELPDGGYYMPLFVVLDEGVELTDELRAEINTAIRTNASPRHVPDDIVAVPAVPHTRTGKKLEVPVKRLIQGTPLEKVTSPEAVDDPEVLRYYQRFARQPAG